MSFVTIGALTFHYRLEPKQDGPALVFLNSLGSDLRIWDGVVSRLSNHTILRYDKRGHGLSDAPAGPYSIRDHTEDLRGLLEHLDLPKPILIGISVGGMIAQDFAATYPEQLKALILCDTGAKIGDGALWNNRIQAIHQDGFEKVAKSVIERWFAPSFKNEHPAAYRGYTNMLSCTPVAGYIGTCEAIRDADLRAKLKTIKARTLVLCGAEDQSTPPSLSEELVEALTDARLELIDKAGHLPCIEQPEVMAQKIGDFLEETRNG